MDEYTQQQTPRTPVRRRQQKPAWERTLRKYFPTIRFVLICILLLLVISLVIKAVVVGISALVNKSKSSAASPCSYSEMMCVTPEEELPYELIQ